eukprot:CAMPEP_0185041652 /NCGR_PEP_ID=MMETSP1103-20130426/41231_1 /TAXON_ID=36769 /ORGANISM="Paraphysomonas bandaiensis, Strain Caron Lab Isolate" /LENGTH=358 /DNA_ID=CAMNT_0027581485 /DNA_START=120 /DNA_END=1193 /DNA_ORIENTATION=-
MCAFGSFGSVRMLCRADSPVFIIAYITGQILMGTIFICSLGVAGTKETNMFQHGSFFSEFISTGDSEHIFSLILGGFVVGHGDFLILTACTRIPFSIAFPIHAGYGMVQGTLLNIIIEGFHGNLLLLSSGIFCALVAIVCMAVSDNYAEDSTSRVSSHLSYEKRTSFTSILSSEIQWDESVYSPLVECGSADESSSEERLTSKRFVNPWVYVCLLGGVCGGLWSPLTTLGRTGENSVDNPYMSLFLFMCGQSLSLPSVLYIYGFEMITRETDCKPVTMDKFFISYYELPFRDRVFGTITGCIVNMGYMCYFISSEVIPSTESFAIAHCAPLVTIFIGVVLFRQLKNATFVQSALIASA